MNDQKMQISLSKEVMDALRKTAEKKGVTPNLFVRQILYERFKQIDTDTKTYNFALKEWHEVEKYVEAKRLYSVEVFAPFAMDRYMAQYPLKTLLKQKGKETIKE